MSDERLAINRVGTENTDMSVSQEASSGQNVPSRLPQCCTPSAFTLLAKQVPVMNSPDALLQGAVAIAMHQMPDADPAQVDAQLQKYADTIRSRVRGSQPQALLAHLH